MDVALPRTTDAATAVASELQIALPRVQAAARLLGEGATVPFISRYRKEATGGLDEIAVLAIRDGLQRL